MNIHLHIERLVLDGLPITSHQGVHVQRAVETELARLLTEGGVGSELAAGGALPSLRAGNIRLTNGATPAQLGRQIGQAVYGGFNPNPTTPSDGTGGPAK